MKNSSGVVPGFENDGFVLKDPSTLGYVKDMCREIPAAATHRNALRHLKSDFSYARRDDDGWTTLIHFSKGIQGMFGFTRDVPLVYVRHFDLQPRTFHGLSTLRSRLPADRACEEHVFLVHSPDLLAAQKLDDWSGEASYLALAIPKSLDERQLASQLIDAIRNRISIRNLFDETLPVTGRDFFGRSQLLGQLVEEIRQGHVCGVYGLRKSGKTSLIKELGQRFQSQAPDSRIYVLRDLEALPNNAAGLIRNIVDDVRADLLAEFRKRSVRTFELAELTASATTGELRRALDASLRACREKGIQVLIALDEIESLLGDAATIARGERGQVPELLGMLRSLVQEHPNFNVLIAGLTSAATERGDLYGRENPLFAWAKSYYVPPMTKPEIDNLTRNVGARMAVSWSEEALDLLYRHSGGQIFMHRTLASEAVKTLKIDVSSRNVSVEMVERVLGPWRRATAQRLAEMIASTRRHYPTECILLEMLAEDAGGLADLEGIYPAEAQHLLDLDLLREDPDTRELQLGPLTRQLLRLGVL